jgi:rod shape determining protein RodA
MKRSINIWKNLDKISMVLFLLLVIMGWFNIHSAVYNEEKSAIFDLSQRYGKQFIWIAAAVVLAVFVVIVDSRFYIFFSWLIYGSVILLMILVLIFGQKINGARSWLNFGGISLQPSEFAKFATALVLAGYLNLKNQNPGKLNVIIPASAIILLPSFLTALQPDMGSSVVFFSLFLVLFREGMSPYIFISGILFIMLFFLSLLLNNLILIITLVVLAFLIATTASRNWKACLIGAAILILNFVAVYVIGYYLTGSKNYEVQIIISLILSGIAYAYYFYVRKAKTFLIIFIFLLGSVVYVNSVEYAFNHLLKPHQKERLEIMLGFKSDPHGTGYNVNQSIISIGSGGFSGKGYLNGTQTKFKFVPSQSTDFIFCTVGEEWGFLGSTVVIGLFLFLLLRLVFLAERQRSVFSRVYGYGVLSILFIHFFINIGMTLGLLPVIGIPLPFISYGGSSLWGFTILLFIFLRLDASRTEYLV